MLRAALNADVRIATFASTAAAPYEALRDYIIPFMRDTLHVPVTNLDGSTYQPHAGWEVNGSAERTVVVAKDFARIASAAAHEVSAYREAELQRVIAAMGGVPVAAPAPSQLVAAPVATPSAAAAPAAGPSGGKRPRDELCCMLCKVQPRIEDEDFCGECIAAMFA